MRSAPEVKLLKIKQHILIALDRIKEEPTVDFCQYLKYRVKLEVCNELIIIARKYAIREAMRSTRGIKCEQ